ncbi:MAG: hypothetical protein KGJ23_06445 [Euryarchaeota archaeon]|nr:hypothetical protein [Euryarchaeota archaeon]MDE1836240.1 hypothetical protein [Euryarchaeota archaeon]MDE1881699.1 hypothetical protein [Euryarchaeota archaeon]MDE2044999.1 hypothetical protein [Thermoplasmata archaeon]
MLNARVRSGLRIGLVFALALVMVLPTGVLRGVHLPGAGPVSGTGASVSSPTTRFDASASPSDASQIAALSSGQPLVFVIGMAYPDPGAVERFLADVENPSSPNYHHFLTSEQFIQRFSPPSTTVDEVRGYFLSRGATSLTVTPDRLSMNFVLPAGKVATTFGTSLAWFRAPSGTEFYAPMAPPHLPAPIARAVSQVDGLTSGENTGVHTFLHSMGSFSVAPNGGKLSSPALFDTTTDGSQVFWGTDYPAAYGAQGLINSGITGTGWAVDTLLWSGFNNSAQSNMPPYDPGAISQYLSATFPSGAILPTITPEAVAVGGATPPPPGTYSLNDDSGAIMENSLDLEMVASTAPGAHVYNWYIPGSALTGQSEAPFYGRFDLGLSAALDFNYTVNGSPHGLAAISNSYGLTDANDSLWDQLEAKAAGQGVTLLVSSGDSGDAPDLATGRSQGEWPTWPATATFDTYGAIAVGGTTITVGGAPYRAGYNPASGYLPPMGYDANQITGLTSQVVWYLNQTDLTTGGRATAGSEGGISSVYNEPLWQAQSAAQSAIKYAAPRESVSYARGVPDISSIANETVIYTDTTPSLSGTFVEGTSIACPVFAGFVVLLDQMDSTNGKGLGFLDPQLYAIGGYFESQAPGSLADPFGGLDDVTSGQNWVFNASVGWDPTTGWGTPNVARLASALLNPTYTGFVYNPNAVPGQAGSNSNPAPGPGYGGLLFLLVVIVAVVVVIAVVAVVVSRRRHHPAPAAGPQVVYHAAAPAPYMAAPHPAYAPYPTAPSYAAPAPYAYGPPTYGYPMPAPVPPPAPPPPMPPPPTAGPVFYCGYCGNPRPYTRSNCPTCGSPL